MVGWSGKLLSLEAKRILIQIVLSSIPIYLLSFLKFPKWPLKLINTQLANYLWSDEEGSRKIHLANYSSIYMFKSYGGMGIPNLQYLNLYLLGSWIKRTIQAEGALWKKVIDAKYEIKGPNILCCNDPHHPFFGKGLCGLFRLLDLATSGILVIGRSVKFWEDV
jgi:hypothetical protein